MEPEDGAGREMFVAPQAPLDVPHRKRQAIERQIRGSAERDQRTAVGDEADQILDALLADPAAVFRANRIAAKAIDDLARRLIRRIIASNRCRSSPVRMSAL